MAVLITGGAGFIGYHVAKSFIASGIPCVLVDNLNSYYSVDLKFSRLHDIGFPVDDFVPWTEHVDNSGNVFCCIDISDKKSLEVVFRNYEFDIVIHMAAQEGVSSSYKKQDAYIKSNINGFFNVLDLSRIYGVRHLIYASSSSVYGDTDKESFTEEDATYNPKSLYAATKKSNELLAASYASMFGMRTTGLRFFSVYGEYGRPDMAIWKWTDSILRGKPITVYGDGTMERDFTYVGDVVRCIRLVTEDYEIDTLDKSESYFGHSDVFNIGNGHPIALNTVVETLERLCNRSVLIKHEDAPACDVKRTCADMTKFKGRFGYAPDTNFAYGIERFTSWINIFS